MTKERIIIWEKFEHHVNTQINISKLLMTGSFLKAKEPIEKSDVIHIDDDDDEDEDDGDEGYAIMQFPITQELLEGIKLASSFECWLAHCSFNITNELVDKLDKIPGIEYLEIISRYRFLIGLGKAFTLTDVRKALEEELGVTTK